MGSNVATYQSDIGSIELSGATTYLFFYPNFNGCFVSKNHFHLEKERASSEPKYSRKISNNVRDSIEIEEYCCFYNRQQIPDGVQGLGKIFAMGIN